MPVRKAPPTRGTLGQGSSVPGRTLGDLALKLADDSHWAAVQEPMRKGTGPEAFAPAPGYLAANFSPSHRDLSSLRAARQLRVEAVNEMGRRLGTQTGPCVLCNMFSLESLYPMKTREGATSQTLPGALFGKMAGGIGRKVGTDVKVLVARSPFESSQVR